MSLGFFLPIFFFVAGCWLRQDEVRAVVAHPAIRSERRLFAALVWLVPISAVGVSVLLLSRFSGALANTDMVLLGAMSVIGLIVLAVSRDVAIFLVDAGLLFEEFFSRIARLADSRLRLSHLLFADHHPVRLRLSHSFRLYRRARISMSATSPRSLSFSESIYFSIVSITTVGYGDIVPHSSLARVLASAEVICGFMLLLFGVSELLEYMREHRHQREAEAAKAKARAARAKPRRRPRS